MWSNGCDYNLMFSHYQLYISVTKYSVHMCVYVCVFVRVFHPCMCGHHSQTLGLERLKFGKRFPSNRVSINNHIWLW